MGAAEVSEPAERANVHCGQVVFIAVKPGDVSGRPGAIGRATRPDNDPSGATYANRHIPFGSKIPMKHFYLTSGILDRETPRGGDSENAECTRITSEQMSLAVGHRSWRYADLFHHQRF